MLLKNKLEEVTQEKAAFKESLGRLSLVMAGAIFDEKYNSKDLSSREENSEEHIEVEEEGDCLLPKNKTDSIFEKLAEFFCLPSKVAENIT